MGEPLDSRALADMLPGTWYIVATNFPMWLSGERRDPTFTYDLVSPEPLVLGDTVTYVDAEGATKQIVGQDTWRDGEFVWRGTKLLKLFASHWSVAGASEAGDVLAIRFSKSLATPAGVDIVARQGVQSGPIRAQVAHATEQFGLTPEDFASLSWLRPPTTG
jgi:hypothetical protein